MRILILSPKLPFPPRDGGSIAILNIAKGLSESGNEITLLSINTKKHYFPEKNIPEDLKTKIRFYSVDHDTSPLPLKAIFNLLFSRKPYISARFSFLSFSRKLREILLSERFDIIQLEGPYMGVYIPLIREISEALISFRAHNVESEIWEGNKRHATGILTRLYFQILARRILIFEREVYKASDLLVPVSEKTDTWFSSAYGMAKHHVSPPGLVVSNYILSDPEKPDSLFFIGALDWKPNQDGLIWFLNEVWNKKESNSEFNVAGRNAPEWLKKILLNTHGVVFHGEVDQANEFIRRYEIMICPLFTGSGIRIKILEAMLLGRVVIATPTAAEGIRVKDGENILIATNPGEFHEKINLLKLKKTYASEIRHNANRFVLENFPNLALCKELSDFYTQNLK